MDADARGCYNVKRLRGAGVPRTSAVLLQNTHSQNYIAIQRNRVLCIPLQDDDPSCKFMPLVLSAFLATSALEVNSNVMRSINSFYLQQPKYKLYDFHCLDSVSRTKLYWT